MAAPPTATKRGPSVLVTDSRERAHPNRSSAIRPTNGQAGAGRARMNPTRLISVDNVLQYASEIPSGQSRGPPGRRPTSTDQRRPSTGVPRANRQSTQNVPGRSSKVSEKLVLIPDTLQKEEDSDEEAIEDENASLEGGERPLSDAELDILKKRGGVRGKSYAERLPKAKRTEKVSRVTAYCTAEGYKMKATAKFIKEQHGARTKLYDDCLYNMYHLPLLPGSDGFRIKSSPVLKSPGGKALLDEEIERSERRDYCEGYFGESDLHAVKGIEESPQPSPQSEEERQPRNKYLPLTPGRRIDSPNRIVPDASTFAEMCVFSYGVVVFWNFTERQEKDILADLTFSEHETGISLVSRPQTEEDFETEELHFQYNPSVAHPRVFNDMITLRSGDHMVKLAISHAIAQSTKLSFFEEKMSQTMLGAEHVPKQLALTGVLGMSRREVVSILGRLFKSRVDVNLSSNILDVPKFFWDSEPTLHPLYTAIREYLEIPPRIKVLNERCRVFLDLAEMLSDSIADTKMSTITWIIIVLIIVSIAVTVTEVILRFAILESQKSTGDFMGDLPIMGRNWSRTDFTERQLGQICGAPVSGHAFAEL